MQDPAVLAGSFQVLNHTDHRPIHLRDTWIWKPGRKNCFPGGRTFSATTDKNYHTAVTHTWHTHRTRFLYLSANLTMPQVLDLHHPEDLISSIPCLKRDLLTKGWRANWIRQERCSGAALYTHRPESARTASFHNHVNETPLKVSKYWNSQHVT